MRGEPALPREASRPPHGTAHHFCKHQLFRFVSCCFQGFAFHLENILEQLNIALVEAAAFTCLCSFSRRPLRPARCQMLADTHIRQSREEDVPAEGTEGREGSRAWEELSVAQGDRC